MKPISEIVSEVLGEELRATAPFVMLVIENHNTDGVRLSRSSLMGICRAACKKGVIATLISKGFIARVRDNYRDCYTYKAGPLFGREVLATAKCEAVDRIVSIEPTGSESRFIKQDGLAVTGKHRLAKLEEDRYTPLEFVNKMLGSVIGELESTEVTGLTEFLIGGVLTLEQFAKYGGKPDLASEINEIEFPILTTYDNPIDLNKEDQQLQYTLGARRGEWESNAGEGLGSQGVEVTSSLELQNFENLVVTPAGSGPFIKGQKKFTGYLSVLEAQIRATNSEKDGVLIAKSNFKLIYTGRAVIENSLVNYPKEVKAAYTDMLSTALGIEVVNYDIKRSQISAILTYADRCNITLPAIESYDREALGQSMGVTDEVMKSLTYALVFGARVDTDPRHTFMRLLDNDKDLVRHAAFVLADVIRDLNIWKGVILPKVFNLAKNKRGMVNNGVITMKASEVNNKAAFMLQGLEANYIYTVMFAMPNILISYEYDGLLVLEEIPPEVIEDAKAASGFLRANLIKKPFI